MKSRIVALIMIGLMNTFPSFSMEKNSTPIKLTTLSSANDEQVQQNFQETVSGSSIPLNKTLISPVRIALIYPSADISDFWVRNYKALTKRLKELRIPFEIKQFSSRQIEHSLQTKYTNDVINAHHPFDFVIFGPSELEIQSHNIKRLAASNIFKTFIWAFHTPQRSWSHQPDAWFDFSSSMGAQVLCDYMVKDLGPNINFALNRGIPGITDTQRSQEFSECVDQKGDWLNMYEHFGQYQKKGGEDGAKLIIKNFPEVTMIHNANTAMTMGTIDALKETDKLDQIFVTGWGGTAKEIEKIKAGELNATPMRMSDDVGVATAEAIKYFLEGKEKQVPEIYLGRITIVSSKMAPEQIDKLTKEAFRYSGY